MEGVGVVLAVRAPQLQLRLVQELPDKRRGKDNLEVFPGVTLKYVAFGSCRDVTM